VSEVVLDASALLALVNQEPGDDVVAELLPRSLVSAVNASELVAKLTDQGMPEDEVQEVLAALNLTVVPFNERQGLVAGYLRAVTKETFAGAGAVAIAIAGAVAGAIAGAVAVAVASAAIGAWYQLKSDPDKWYLKALAVLAFPWFCWLPIVSILTTWALYDLLSQFSPVNHIPIWPQTALGVAVVAGVWAALWHRGQWLDARARNPFHGGALGAALGVKRLEVKKSSSA
jgi:PIN domain nuclease of toxin-antitoxin system